MSHAGNEEWIGARRDWLTSIDFKEKDVKTDKKSGMEYVDVGYEEDSERVFLPERLQKGYVPNDLE